MRKASATDWDRSVDTVVVGSGGSGLTAALAAADAGAETLVLEKAEVLGGTTAVSGGAVWIPNSRPVVEAIGENPPEDVQNYIRQIAGGRVPDEMIRQFVERGPKVVDRLEEETPLEFAFAHYPDYHPQFRGGRDEGQSIVPKLYDGNRLGDRLDDVRDNPQTPIPTTIGEMMTSGGMAKFPVVADWEELAERMENNQIGTGQALIAGLYETCLDRGVDFETDAPAEELVVDDDAVVGLVAEVGGEETAIEAESVVIAAGGMEWDEELCEHFLAGPMDAPTSVPQNEGDGIKMGMEIGAKLGNMNEAWWCPAGHVPGESWEDGSPLNRILLAERTLPATLMVNADGERFCNESGNYVDLGKRFRIFDPHDYEYENLPAYVIFDQSARERYAMLTVMPHQDDPEWLVSGETLEELAEKKGIDPQGLRETVKRFNEHAREGEDPDFHRGQSGHDRETGDADADHPNLAPLNEPPFYAIDVQAGSLGTKGGLVTTPEGAVVDVNDEEIPGLYAASNGTSHVMGIGYAGGGGTLGPNVVFGYLAGESAAERATDIA
ncbi:FAD-dependent oxidoreductase [Natrialbaceae archaeon GCM10025810]|uniref:FAD-dependent oxidoreductase n=1 Tax=Halovalidus salilacus TaxID=3075124 RepID=UPI003617D99C